MFVQFLPQLLQKQSMREKEMCAAPISTSSTLALTTEVMTAAYLEVENPIKATSSSSAMLFLKN